jgi:hypothetical protein
MSARRTLEDELAGGSRQQNFQSRVGLAIVYSLIGLIPLTLIPFYFSPWWPFSWIYFAIVLVWVAAGIIVDPYRLFPDTPSPLSTSLIAGMVRRWPVLALALLLLLPFIAYNCKVWSFFPWWGPWDQLARYWVPRELVVSSLFVIVISILWARLTFGRRLALLFGFLFSSHVMLLLTYAVIYPSPDYLQDGYTQDYFVSQLRFKIIFGVLLFLALHWWTEKKKTAVRDEFCAQHAVIKG